MLQEDAPVKPDNWHPDASKMHPLFQALCLIICSEILPYLNKTAVSDAVFSKVSLLAIFAGNKIREKYHVNIYGKEAHWTKDGHEGVQEGQKGWSHAATVLGRVGTLNWASGTVSPLVFDVCLHI